MRKLTMSRGATKILIKASSYLGTNANGAEVHTTISMINLINKNFELIVCGAEVYPDCFDKFTVKPFFRYNWLPKFFRFPLHQAVAFIETLRAYLLYRPNFLFCTGGVYYNGLAILLVGKIFGVASIVRTAEDHVGTALNQDNFLSFVIHKFYICPLSLWVLRNCDRVVTVGDKSAEYFSEVLQRRDNILVARNPIGIRRSEVDFQNRYALRQKLGLPMEKSIAIYAGAISVLKGTDILPDIIKEANKLSDDWWFVVVGSDRSPNKTISARIKKAGPNNVTFRPALHRDCLLEYFRAADVLVFLCRTGVGYGLVTVEAALCGTAVMCLNPKLDVADLHGRGAQNVEEMVVCLLNRDYKVPDVSRFLDVNAIKSEHLNIFYDVIGR